MSILDRSHFHGPENKAQVEKELGTLLVAEGRFEEAVPYLRAAVSEPHVMIHGYRELAKALDAMGEHDEVEALFVPWKTAAEAQGNVEAQADCLGWQAEYDLREGSRQKYEELLTEATALYPGGEQAAALGRLLVEEGRHDEAAAVFNTWLWSGGRLYNGARPKEDDGTLTATLEAWESALRVTRPDLAKYVD